EDRQHSDEDERRDRIERQRIEEVEQHGFWGGVSVESFDPIDRVDDRGTTEYRKRQNQDERRYPHCHKREFTQCPSTRDSRDKRTNEWGPSDPPCPVERGPPGLELHGLRAPRQGFRHHW